MKQLFTFTLIIPILLLGLFEKAVAVQPTYTFTNLQPVTSLANSDTPYEPLVFSALYLEPVLYPIPHGDQHRMNADIEIRNDGTDYILLDEIGINYPGATLSDRILMEHELLQLPQPMLLTDLGTNKDLRRSMLDNGGFAVSGFRLEQYIEDSNRLPFGEAMAVISIDDDAGEGYLVAGDHQSLTGDAPTSLADSYPSTHNRGFIARYSTGGNIQASQSTLHDKVSAMVDLNNGQFLLAGVYSPSLIAGTHRQLLINRVATFKDYFNFKTKFGTDPDYQGTLLNFHDSHGSCDVLHVPSIEVVNQGKFYVAVAELECKKGLRAGVAVLDGHGKAVSSFGSGGTKVFDGPNGNAIIPVGISRPKGIFGIFSKKTWIWLGAASGDSCVESGLNLCDFALTRFDLKTGALHATGWVVPSLPSIFQNVIPYDMDVDALGRPILAGTGWKATGNRQIAVHRFTVNGLSDPGFGVSGWGMHILGAAGSEARGVVAASGLSYGLAVRSLKKINGTTFESIGIMKLSSFNGFIWSHDSDDSNSYFTHNDINASFNYGYIYENKLESTPAAAIAENSEGGFIIAGQAVSKTLQNPCAINAIKYEEPQLDIGDSCGGPSSIALLHYLPIGKPDSRRWLAPNEMRRILLPEDRDLGSLPPESVEISFKFNGYTEFSIIPDAIPFQNAVFDIETGSFGSYRFPLKPNILKNQERFYVKSHSLDHHHRSTESNRFAYDISMVRYDGSGWTRFVEESKAKIKENTDYLIWNKPVRALTNGDVISCRRNVADNKPGTTGSSWNFVKVRFNIDPFDASKTEYITYGHLAKGSIPIEVCPNICPDSKPACDVETEGVDPNGSVYSFPIPIEVDTTLGYIGNSGKSTAPHLHIHLTTGADDPDISGPTAGSYPLLFNSVLIQSEKGKPDDKAYELTGHAIPHGTLAIPTD